MQEVSGSIPLGSTIPASEISQNRPRKRNGGAKPPSRLPLAKKSQARPSMATAPRETVVLLTFRSRY